MAEELGRIERPSASRYQLGRRLYMVPLIYALRDAPADFLERFERYWQEVQEYLWNLESKIGVVRRVYHESVARGGEEGLKLLERLNAASHAIARRMCEAGAVFEPVEDAELENECLDWERCLMLGFLSRTAADHINQLYRDSSRRRWEHIARRIDESLGSDEVAVLFMRQGHQLQFPPDIEVFLVAPPSLDALQRWLRDQSHEGPAPADQPEGEAEGGGGESSGE